MNLLTSCLQVSDENKNDFFPLSLPQNKEKLDKMALLEI